MDNNNLLSSVLSEKPSRLLFCFLILNLTFAVVELLYGIWANSLGLVADSFHMFFDSTALFAGLVATVISKWQANESYSYGYVRAEILAGFLNCIFLMFIAFFIFAEAVQRIIDPQDVHHERLFFVSVAGFIVNVTGIFIFHHGHSHRGMDSSRSSMNDSIMALDNLNNLNDQEKGSVDLINASSDHEHDASGFNSQCKIIRNISSDLSHRSVNQVSSDHSVNSSDHRLSQSDYKHNIQSDDQQCQIKNDLGLNQNDRDFPSRTFLNNNKYIRKKGSENYSFSTTSSQVRIMQGVFLHLLADTLGSVGVMLSSFLISYFGWVIADPICSVLIASLIVISIFPLLHESVGILMQRTPEALEWQLPICYQMVNDLEGVYSIIEAHFWTACTDEYVGTIKLEAEKNADTQSIIRETNIIFLRAGVNQLNVQIDQFSS